MISKTSDFIKNYYFIFLPIVITVVFYLTNNIIFIVNDDIGMMNIAESFKTNLYSEQLVFINVVFGFLLKALYNLIPGISWFAFLELFILNVSCITLLSIVKKYNSNIIGLTTVCLIQTFFLTNFTFTSISFICSISAVLFYIANVEKINKENGLKIIYAVILLFLAFALRGGQTFILIVAISLPILFFSVIKKRNAASAIILLLVLCTIANYSLVAINNNYYNKAYKDSDYLQFQSDRAAVLDYGELNYETHKDAFDEAEISENDYYLMYNWSFADKKVFSQKAFNTIANSRAFLDKYDFNIPSILGDFFTSGMPTLLMYILFLITIFICVSIPKRRLECLMTFFLTIAGVGYTYFIKRGLPRINNATIICGIIIAILIYLQNQKDVFNNSCLKKLKTKNTKIIVSILCLALFVSGSAINAGIAKKSFIDSDIKTEIQNYIEENSNISFVNEALYPTDSFTIEDYSKNVLIKKIFGNPFVFSLGGWDVYSYCWKSDLEANGFGENSDSLFLALLNDNVYYVGTHINPDSFVMFYKEHYNFDVEYSEVYEFNGFPTRVYSFYKVK